MVQASAADWASALLAVLRGRLAELAAGRPDRPAARLVFFQHDEVVVHAPAETAEAVVAAVLDAADQARRLVFGDTPVRFPVRPVAVQRYSDAK